MSRYQSLLIHGVGLLGGSIGLAVRSRNLAERVMGLGRNEQRLKTALAMGALDEYTTDVKTACRECDFAVVCLPVGLIPAAVLELAEHLPPQALITDVGSTKAILVRSIAEGLAKRKSPIFIGSHPMAGSEKTGVEFARADLYEGAACILTPQDETPKEAMDTMESFWKQLGARVYHLSPELHDQLVASVSHVPHLAAAALARILGAVGESEPVAYDLIGEGFRDTTRIAAGDPVMWRDICLDNRQAISDALQEFIRQLDHIRTLIQTGQAGEIEKILSEGKNIRRRVDRSREKEA